MGKLLNEGDCVEVTFSNSGYTGPGELISIAYGTTWLVRVNVGERITIITVKSQYLEKISEAKAKRNALLGDQSLEEAEEGLEYLSPKERKKMEKQIRKEKKRQAMKGRN